MENTYYPPLYKSLADELKSSANATGIKLGHQRSLELIAKFHGFNKYASLRENGLLSGLRYPVPAAIGIDWNAVKGAISSYNDELTVDDEGPICGILYELYCDECDPLRSLSKRLARRINVTCDFGSDNDYAGTVLLDYEDWKACGDIASLDAFVDGLYRLGPWPSIAAIAMSKPDRQYGGLYPVEPGSILNILAFLRPDDWPSLLQGK
ncbi:hypothetical protein [Aromatoleum petrolei]|uniref:Uncharacterized protein n=1 Tax=Aromatoleum petrolei TaxID=76116 RepID=A0ABX1MUI6_9RHOO|nr:hypothetical protein [Aromatoleum petrolei]NMF89996.1 hypothetical protein [Aromatoleum petrolei]